MFYLDYDLPQLVRIAEDKLRIFDKERLTIPKPLDAFDFIEFDNGLGLETDSQRLTPNLSIWGLTAFNDGHWWVWPEGSELPKKHLVKKGTILIDERLLSPDAGAGWRNFTLLHEGFHWVLHPRVFKKQEVVYQRHCDRTSVSSRIGNKKPSLTGIQITEWQANCAAAVFLMPREAVTFAFREVLKVPTTKTLPIQWTLPIDFKVYDIADMFSASYTAMKYIPEPDFEYAFITMMNKLIFGHQLVLRPLLMDLRGINSEDSMAKLHELDKKLEENAEQQNVLVSLMTKKYLEPAVYKKSHNELLQEAERIQRQKESISRFINSDNINLHEVSELLQYATKAAMPKSFDGELFARFVERIQVYSRTEIGFELKCGITLKERLVR